MRIGDVAVLLRDYRRLARVGWAAALAAGGAAVLADDVALPGRFMHFEWAEVRMREVAALLQDYRELLEMAEAPPPVAARPTAAPAAAAAAAAAAAPAVPEPPAEPAPAPSATP